MMVNRRLEGSSEGLPQAWNAVTNTLQGKRRQWFPDDVPVLLAMVDSSAGPGSDTGFDVRSKRVLLRVVGWGGEKP